jgi:hypothetical protein
LCDGIKELIIKTVMKIRNLRTTLSELLKGRILGSRIPDNFNEIFGHFTFSLIFFEILMNFPKSLIYLFLIEKYDLIIAKNKNHGCIKYRDY